MANSLKGANIRIEGIEDAMRNLQKVGDLMGMQNLQHALMVGAKLVRDRAKQLVRLGPGPAKRSFSFRGVRHRITVDRAHLRDLIFATPGKSRDATQPSVIAGVDLKKAPHAHLVEFGHGGPRPAPPHPYIRPALDQSRKDIPKLVEDMIRRILQDAGINP